jgi:hypothetical protein
MKRWYSLPLLVIAAAVLTTAIGTRAQTPGAVESRKAIASFAHLTVAPRSLAFGTVKAIATKQIVLKNTGNVAANITVSAPSSGAFSLTSGGGSFSLSPGSPQDVVVQFAPTVAGKFASQLTISCSNCNTAADGNFVAKLSGSAKGSVTGVEGNALSFSVSAGPFDNADQGFTSITVCAHGTSNCNVINNVLIDTGSTGLRVFGSQLAGLGINPNTNGASEIGECAFFGSGVTFGGVSTVDVQIAGEPTITLPIQVIDDIGAFPGAPHDCTEGATLIASPSDAGFYALLGTGQVANDQPNIYTQYYNCGSNFCSDNNKPPVKDVVLNPVSLFPVDNNGVVVNLPAIAAGGEVSVDGTLYFGIGTESNNSPGPVTVLRQETNINSLNYLGIETTFEGVTAGAFFDMGSNGFFFNSNITQCTDAQGFYCPASDVAESATNLSVGTSASTPVSFTVSNADTLFNSNNLAFDDLGGTNDGGSTFDGFDWGLPFFFGRTVFLAIDGKTTPLGKGPYTAY